MHGDNVSLPFKHSETKINLHLHMKLQFVTHSDLSLLPLESLVVYSFLFNLLAPELLFFLILAHSVYKMWITQEPDELELWNKLHFEGEKGRV